MHRSISRLTFALSLLSAVAVHAQTVDEIIAKNLLAKGGAEKWQSVSSVKMSGTMTVQGKELPLTVYAKRPNLNRQEIALPDGKVVVQAFDGTTAWMINPMSDQPQTIPADAADVMKNSADFDGALINYKAKGHTIALVGKETLRDKPVYHLKVTMKGGQVVQDYFLDAESGIELKTSAQVDLGMDPSGKKQPLDTEMSNYKAIDGIMIPHTIKQFMNGNQSVQMSITSVQFNAPIDDAIFKMPTK
jgi:outer membrane lipoprotein-sorting protein